MCILAHPDDESLGAGGTLARYASEGVGTYVVTATRGERGRFHAGHERPTPDIIGQVREAELRAAASQLGVSEVHVLGYPDGALDTVDHAEVVSRLVHHLRIIRPQVVITFAPDGAYGHPDHIATSQLATAAIVCAADTSFELPGQPATAHRVSKLYFMAWSAASWECYQAALKKLVVTVDGEERHVTAWPDWALTTRIDATPYWRQVWRAVSCHATQVGIYERLGQLSDEQQRTLWGTQAFYRAFSTVNGGRRTESDLFEGVP